MKIEFLDEGRDKARITRGWLRKVVAVVTKVPYSSSKVYPQIGWSYYSARWVYEGTDIYCSDSVAISKYAAKLERMVNRARDKEQRDQDRHESWVKKQAERDHLQGLRENRLPAARVVQR